MIIRTASAAAGAAALSADIEAIKESHDARFRPDGSPDICLERLRTIRDVAAR